MRSLYGVGWLTESPIIVVINSLTLNTYIQKENIMSKSNRRKVLDRRRAKKEKSGRIVKDKFNNEEQGTYIAPKVYAKNPVQDKFLQALKNYQAVVYIASAGSGKSFLTMSTVADKLKSGNINKVILSRPAVGMGNSVGLLKGDLKDKYTPYLLPLIDVIKKRYGTGFYETCLSNGTIEMLPLEYVRGRNIDEVLIVDEAQNILPSEMFTILTRVADGGQVIFLGDETQSDLRCKNALQWLPTYLGKHKDLLEYIHIVIGHSDSIERGGMCKALVKAREKDTGPMEG